MESRPPSPTTFVIMAQFFGLVTFMMSFAIMVGMLLSDEPWSRFIGIGVLMSLSGMASVRKRHIPSVLILLAAVTGFLMIVVLKESPWPLLLVMYGLLTVGLVIWVRSRVSSSGAGSSDSSGERVIGNSVTETGDDDEITLDGTATDLRRIVTSQAFRGGFVSASLGAIEIDLRDARLDEDGATLFLSSRMGNITLRVPHDWVVEVNGSIIMGAVEDQRAQQPATGPLLSLDVTALMGGVQITE